MSIEYATAIGFGITISSELAEKILSKIEENHFEDYDTFYEEHCHQINSWCGGDYFFGFISFLGDSSVIPLDGVLLRFDKFEFEAMIDKWDLNEFIDKTITYPRTCVITFCY